MASFFGQSGSDSELKCLRTTFFLLRPEGLLAVRAFSCSILFFSGVSVAIIVLPFSRFFFDVLSRKGAAGYGRIHSGATTLFLWFDFVHPV